MAYEIATYSVLDTRIRKAISHALDSMIQNANSLEAEMVNTRMIEIVRLLQGSKHAPDVQLADLSAELDPRIIKPDHDKPETGLGMNRYGSFGKGI